MYLSKYLVGGGTNPFEKYARQNGNFPQVGMKMQKYFKTPPSCIYIYILGCPAGSDRNDRDRKLVYFTYLRDVNNLYIGVI